MRFHVSEHKKTGDPQAVSVRLEKDGQKASPEPRGGSKAAEGGGVMTDSGQELLGLILGAGGNDNKEEEGESFVGVVKSFSPEKGYGFIECEAPSPQLFSFC